MSPSTRRSTAIRSAVLLLLAWSSSALSAQPVTPDSILGPIPLRAISPLRLLFFQLTPSSAETLGRGHLNVGIDISESNVLHTPSRSPSEFDAELNLEITRVNLRLNFGVSQAVDLGIELPIYRFHTGFLDDHIRNVEDFFGDLKERRVFEREDPMTALFGFRLKHNGEVFFENRGPRSGLGDLALTVKRRMHPQKGRRPALSLRAALKLPSGDERYAMSSGATDLAVGIAGDYQWKHWAVYGNLNGTYPFGDPFESVGLLSPPMLSGHLGGAYRPGDRWAYHFQLAGTSEPFEAARGRQPSTFPSQPFENFGGSIIEGILGASRQLNRKTEIYLALAEDIQNTNSAAADVTLLVSFGLRGW